MVFVLEEGDGQCRRMRLRVGRLWNGEDDGRGGRLVIIAFVACLVD